MGRDDGIAVILRDLIRPRAAYVAAPPAVLPAIETAYRVDPGLRWSGCGWTGRSSDLSGQCPAAPAGRIGELNRLYQLGFASWLPSTAIADGVYYGLRVNGQLVAAAGPMSSARAPAWRSLATS